MRMTPAERARRCAEILWERDEASRALGIELEWVSAGGARCSLLVESRHANGHGICHGGIVFMLADTAFAFACNGYNRATVAQHDSITFVDPARVGERLYAEASESSLRGRSGVYDVHVTREDGETVALFRGCSRVIDGNFFDEER